MALRDAKVSKEIGFIADSGTLSPTLLTVNTEGAAEEGSP